MTDWIINGIKLDEAPSSDIKRISRNSQSDSINKFFPGVYKSTAVSYDYIITGRMYNPHIAYQLHQLAKSPDTEIVYISSPEDHNNHWIGNGLYNIKAFEIKRTGPKFVSIENEVHEVIEYTMTFTQFADQGDNQDSIEGSYEYDESGLGAGDLSHLLGQFSGENYDYTRWDEITLFGALGNILGI